MKVSWVGSLCLKRKARPQLENQFHRDTSLRITIHEVKKISPQKRYFCDICLDRKLYARTTSKLGQGTVFWGELFDLNNLPQLTFITINLYYEADLSKEVKRRKNDRQQNQLIAYITIVVADLLKTEETQHWYSMTLAAQNNFSNQTDHIGDLHSRSLSNEEGVSDLMSSTSAHISNPSHTVSDGIPTRKCEWRFSKHKLTGFEQKCLSLNCASQSKEPPQIRLSVKYQSLDVLPLSYYTDLRKIATDKYLPLIEYLEPVLTARKKEVFAKCLVNIHEKLPGSDVSTFLGSLVARELEKLDNVSLLFRSNSIGSKAVEAYIKLVGAEYLHKCFHDLIEQIICSDEDLEVDNSRIYIFGSNSSNNLQIKTGTDDNLYLRKNQESLQKLVQVVWQNLKSNLSYFPSQLRDTMRAIRETVEAKYDEYIADQMISSCLFLRFLCPALHGPALFGLTNTVPDEPRVCRNLTLVAKVLQTMANFSQFETKESYMRFMNKFVMDMEQDVRGFLRNVSTTKVTDRHDHIWIKRCKSNFDYKDSIDLGYELTVLYIQLSEVCEHVLPKELSELPSVLNTIKMLFNSTTLRRCSTGGVSMKRIISYTSDSKSSAELEPELIRMVSETGLHSATNNSPVSTQDDFLPETSPTTIHVLLL